MYEEDHLHTAHVILPRMDEELMYDVLEELVWAFQGLTLTEVTSIAPAILGKEVKVTPSVTVAFHTTLNRDNGNATLQTCIDRLMDKVPAPAVVTYRDFHGNGFIRTKAS